MKVTAKYVGKPKEQAMDPEDLNIQELMEINRATFDPLVVMTTAALISEKMTRAKQKYEAKPYRIFRVMWE